MITHIKRLKESLTVLQLLAGALPSNDTKFSNNYSDIEECLSKLIDSLINDVKKYLKFEPENSDCVIQIANKYEQIFQIYEAAEIIQMTDFAACSQKIFDRYDSDHDGNLTSGELKPWYDLLAAARADLALTSDDYYYWFAAIGQNQDGSITTDKLAAYLASINFTESDSNLKKDVGAYWIKSIKKTLLKI
jgi:hypothetical protein